MIRRLTVLLLAAGALAAGATATSAATPKPIGYVYSSCSSRTTICKFEAVVGAKTNEVSIGVSGICTVAGEGLSYLGYLPIKHGGRFSVSKTVSFQSERSYRTETLHAQESGTVKAGKSIIGTLRFTTSNAECASETGVLKSFSLKYRGPTYGG